jgi:RNA polymerase sigma-70 factor (ECF subfamily)
VDPHAELLQAEERARVRAAIALLPERQGQLLLHAGLSYAEIADALDIAPGGVGTLLARAERAFVGTYERLNQAEHEDTFDTRIL